MKVFLAYFFTGLVFFLSQSDAQQQLVNVTVYYESLCPFAKKFIVEQLHPTLEGNLSKYVRLELVPYGKAETNNTGSNVTFKCHHGEWECYGNLIQGCSRNLIEMGSNSPNISFNIYRLRFLSCFMGNLTIQAKKEDVDSAIDRCVSNAHGLTAVQLKDCAVSPFGKSHLTQNGKLTDEFQKPLLNIPTIVYDGVFNKNESDESEKDFRRVLCSKIIGEKPEDCIISVIASRINPNSASRTNLITNAQLLLVTLILVFSSFVFKM